MNRSLLVLGLAAVVVACGAPPDEAATPTDGVRPTRQFTLGIDTLWSRSSADEGWAHIAAQAVAAGRGRVALLDPEGVTFLDAAGRMDGRHALGAGAGSSRAAALVIDPEGGALVLQGGTATRVLPDRGALPAVVLADHWSLHTACAPDAGAVVLTGGIRPIALVGPDGQLRREWPYPWPALRDSALLLQQVLVASTPGVPGCVVAQSVAGGFATTVDGVTFDTATYVEQFPLPVITTRVDSTADGVVRRQSMPREVTYTARRLAASERHIVIAFGGATPRRRGLIDVYDRVTRAYLGSAMLEVPIQEIAASGDTLYVLHDAEGTSQLAALRLRPAPRAS